MANSKITRKEAILLILEESFSPLHFITITDKIVAYNLVIATKSLESNVNSILGQNSEFICIKKGTGMWGLKGKDYDPLEIIKIKNSSKSMKSEVISENAVTKTEILKNIILSILKSSLKPLHFKMDITRKIISDKLFEFEGKYPHEAVKRVVCKYDEFICIKKGSGLWGLKGKDYELKDVNKRKEHNMDDKKVISNDVLKVKHNKNTKSFNDNECNLIASKSEREQRIGHNKLRKDLLENPGFCVIIGIKDKKLWDLHT